MQKETRKESLSRELYSKRFNYLIYGIPESCKTFCKFVAEDLQIKDTSMIKLVYIYRLPQHPIFMTGTSAKSIV